MENVENSGTRRCWTTLITRSSYLPGALLLAHSLNQHGTRYPLVLFYTPSTLGPECVGLLETEAKLNPIVSLRETTHLLPPRKVSVVASRFEDTWTKLRCFATYDNYRPEDDGDTRKQDELDSTIVQSKGATNKTQIVGSRDAHGYDEVCYLDADMLVLQAGMDDIFTTSNLRLPPDDSEGQSWIAATHACVCNLDNDPWAEPEWKRENCAYTPLKHPAALSAATPVPNSDSLKHRKPSDHINGNGATSHQPHTYTLLNSGLFLFKPSRRQYLNILEYLSTSPLVEKFSFPDQDLITEFFRDRWLPIPWKFNALKTWRYQHGPRLGSVPLDADKTGTVDAVLGPASDRDPYISHPAIRHETSDGFWRDEEVINLHYIVDKPWSSRVRYGESPDPKTGLRKIGGYMDKDGETHAWWWRQWDRFIAERTKQGGVGRVVVAGAEKLVARDDGKPMEGSAEAIKLEKSGEEGK